MPKKKTKKKPRTEYTKKDLIKYLEKWFRDDPEDTIYNISGRTQLLISIKEPDMTKSQFNQIMKKFDVVETKIDNVKSELKQDIQSVDAKVDALEEKVDALEEKVDANTALIKKYHPE